MGAKLVSMAEVSSKNGGGGGQSAGGGRNGKLLSVYGNQQKIRNFENFGTISGQNVIHGDLIENVSIINGNVSVINGKPTQTFNFKLTPAILALRVCKPEGGRRFVTYLGAKEFKWPKVLSGGPEITKQSDGLVKAQLVAIVSSLNEGTLVKPNSFKGCSVSQSSWVIGESLRGRTMGDSRSLVIAVVLESKVCASAPNGDPIQVASMVSLPVRLEGDHLDKVASATEVSKLGFIGMEVTNRRKRDTTVRLMGRGIDVSSDNRHHGAAQNHFSPLSDLGS